jgi:hypothetical protein
MDLKSRSGINSPTARPEFVDLSLNNWGEVEQVDEGGENRDEDDGADREDEKQFRHKNAFEKNEIFIICKVFTCKTT